MFIKCQKIKCKTSDRKTVQVKVQLDNEGVFLTLNRAFYPQNGALCGSKVKWKHLETNTNMTWVWLHHTQWGDRETAGPSVSGGSNVQMVTSGCPHIQTFVLLPVFSCKDRIIKSNPNAVWESRRQREGGKLRTHSLRLFCLSVCVFYECVSLLCLHVKSSLIRSCGGGERIGTFHLNLSCHTQGWRDLIYGCAQVELFVWSTYTAVWVRLQAPEEDEGGREGLDVIYYRLQITCRYQITCDGENNQIHMGVIHLFTR